MVLMTGLIFGLGQSFDYGELLKQTLHLTCLVKGKSLLRRQDKQEKALVDVSTCASQKTSD